MYKKLFVIIIICLVLSFSIPVFAVPDEFYQRTGDKIDGVQSVGADKNSETSSKEESGVALNKEIENIVAQKDAEVTKQFLLTITRPDGDEITPRKSYVICGVANEGKEPEDLVVVLSVFNESTETYELLSNIDGESSWDVGSFGMFTKEVMLKEGANKLKIVVYSKSADKWQVGVNVQVNTFTVTVLKEGIKQKIANGTLKISEIFQGILPSPTNSKK